MRVFGRRRRREPAVVGPWSRPRLLLLLVAVATAGVLVVAGLGFAVVYAVRDTSRPSPATSSGAGEGTDLSVRDRIAAQPMVEVDPQAAFTPDPALTAAARLLVPSSTTDGLAGVRSGFPHTAAGAVGQWAAIHQRVLEQMSLPDTALIHDAWVLPDGPEVASWEPSRNVEAFLTAARQGGVTKDYTTLVTATPVAALVKGTDGPDWVLACVLFDVQAQVKGDARMGYGTCSRMEWVQGRWQVAAGPQPAPAPSTWPGSKAALAAGWLTWIEAAA